uniref:Biotin carboxyl carrier protein of acetyl-CoA carboxylase n=1 Tax=Osmundea sinicola TaxID=290685 RepID=A0A7L4WNR9_9FLOR|nr:acetyl-CoA carboxylase biotin carboxyl carrier protein [Osmundea sinicola]QFR99915.1 acetyl-CoA carboxylase biotin carboxyl carrier protein [Osmundea sinicola]
MQSLNNIKNLVNSIKNKHIKQIKIEYVDDELIINKTKKQLVNINKYSNSQKINKKIKNKNEKTNNNNIDKNRKQSLNQDNPVQTKIVDHSITYSTIISPMVGTFYRSPAPNEEPFIEVSSIVKTKQTVCIIEAMKLMNEIEAEVQGEIVEILVQDGDIVDCGQALMKVKAI